MRELESIVRSLSRLFWRLIATRVSKCLISVLELPYATWVVLNVKQQNSDTYMQYKAKFAFVVTNTSRFAKRLKIILRSFGRKVEFQFFFCGFLWFIELNEIHFDSNQKRRAELKLCTPSAEMNTMWSWINVRILLKWEHFFQYFILWRDWDSWFASDIVSRLSIILFVSVSCHTHT